jgi:hypothetical protein
MCIDLGYISIYRLYLCTKMAKYGSGYPTLVTITSL